MKQLGALVAQMFAVMAALKVFFILSAVALLLALALALAFIGS